MDELAPGSRFGRYEVVRLIGSGAMGRVYEAIMVELHKRVAIKTLHTSHGTGEEMLERFLREGRAAARVRHNHLVQIFDVGIEKGVPFLAMEFLEGQNLQQRFDEGPMDVQELIDLALPIAAAVAAAHDVGVIHRDLKPENIFLSREQGGHVRPIVVDFGVSKLSGHSVRLTKTASIMGTPLYMSPEQAGDPRGVDARTDQYSLAVVIYEGLCGRVPYDGETLMELLSKISEGNPPKPRELRPDLPEQLEEVILRGIHVKAAERFESMYAFGAALLPFASKTSQSKWIAVFNVKLRSSRPPDPQESEPQTTNRKNTTLRGAATSAETQSKAAGKQGLRILGAVAALCAVAFAAYLLRHTSTAPPDPAAAAEAPSAEKYTVKIAALPRDAEIALDGAPVAKGSFSTRLSADGRSHTIEISREGYESQSVTFRDAPPPERFELQEHATPQPVVSVPRVTPAPSVAPPVKPKPAPRVTRAPHPAPKPKPEAQSQQKSADATPQRPVTTPNNAPILE